MCKVSVLVPIFNAQPYLRECLGSILNQSLRELEIICINDGSTDGSLDILHAYQQKDRRIQIISQENAGYGHAINAGLRVARGEYIGIVEADDYISSDMYQILWKTAHRHSLDMVKGDYSYFADRDGQRRFDRVMICPELNWYCKKLAPFRTPSTGCGYDECNRVVPANIFNTAPYPLAGNSGRRVSRHRIVVSDFFAGKNMYVYSPQSLLHPPGQSKLIGHGSSQIPHDL